MKITAKGLIRHRPELPEQHERLLAACTGKREHLRLIVIAVIDTGLRYSEMCSLVRADVDLEGRIITVRKAISKTGRKHYVPISERMAVELIKRLPMIEPNELVFGMHRSIEIDWANACGEVGLEGVRLSDLRHWSVQNSKRKDKHSD